MTIDEAIKEYMKMLGSQRGEGCTRRLDALKLGIEALKQWKLYRSGYVPSQNPLLPGETIEEDSREQR